MCEPVWFNYRREVLSVDRRILEVVTGEKALNFVGIKNSWGPLTSGWDIFIN